MINKINKWWHPTKNNDDVADSTEPFPSWVSAMKQNGPTEEKEHKAAERSQWTHQKWTQSITVAISTIALIGALASACFAYSAFKEAQRQANAVFADQRPWVRVKLNFGSLTFAENGDAIITYETCVRNIGRSPARNLQSSLSARVMTEKGAINTIDEQKWRCGIAADNSKPTFSR
jgi:hypothetical protein